jgi:hypothetical protein
MSRALGVKRLGKRDHLAVLFDELGIAESGELADTALDALTAWRSVDS